MGLATLPRKNTFNATETNIREQDVNGARNEEIQNWGMMMDHSQIAALFADTHKEDEVHYK